MGDDFYLEAECCTMCGVPDSIAPELFGMGEHACFIRRQPGSQSEIDTMLKVMRNSEFDCIRYRGDDFLFLRRMGEAGLADYADDKRVLGFPELRRDTVVFSLPVGRQETADTLAGLFRDYLRRNTRFTVRPPFLRRRRVSFAWYKVYFHSVVFGIRPDGIAMAALRPSHPDALKGLAETVDGWLRDGFGAADIAWHAKEGLAIGESGFRLPY